MDEIYAKIKNHCVQKSDTDRREVQNLIIQK